MKKIIMTIVMMFIIVMTMGCANKAEELNEKITVVLESNQITQTQLDEIFSEYDSLSDSQKEKIENYDKIEKYKNVDIETVNKLNEEIGNINSGTSFDSILELQKSVNNLNSDEKALVDLEKLEESLKLSDIEKAAVAACQYIKKSLKNSSSFELESVKAIDDTTGSSRYYLVKVQYSATNGFGGRQDSSSFQTISSSFENPWYGFAILTGKYEEALQCSSFLSFYLGHSTEPIEFDNNKIMYYIDEQVN